MNSNLIKELLKDHKPKDLKETLTDYTKTKQLQEYRLLNRKTREKLEIHKTYIRYVSYKTAFKDENYSKHIKPGGFLVGGGYYDRSLTGKAGKYIRSNDTSKWTHIILMYKPNKKYLINKQKEKQKKQKEEEDVIEIDLTT